MARHVLMVTALAMTGLVVLSGCQSLSRADDRPYGDEDYHLVVPMYEVAF